MSDSASSFPPGTVTSGLIMGRYAVIPADGVPCIHPGCLSHIKHPCEGCGRIGGKATSYAAEAVIERLRSAYMLARHRLVMHLADGSSGGPEQHNHDHETVALWEALQRAIGDEDVLRRTAMDGLLVYANHRDDCRVFQIGTMNAKPEDCTCGLEATRGRLRRKS